MEDRDCNGLGCALLDDGKDGYSDEDGLCAGDGEAEGTAFLAEVDYFEGCVIG